MEVDSTFSFTLSAKGTFYVDCGTGGTFSMPAANVTCTAQYVANTLDLTWYAENGTTVVANSPDCTYNQTFTNLPTPPTKNGYHFTHWKLKE